MSGDRKRSPRRVGDLLPEVAGRLGLENELRLARAMSTWTRLVEELVPAAAGASRVLEVRPPLLVVAAEDALAGQELRLRSDELLAAFAAAPGGMRLLELLVVVRPRSALGGRRAPRVD